MAYDPNVLRRASARLEEEQAPPGGPAGAAAAAALCPGAPPGQAGPPAPGHHGPAGSRLPFRKGENAGDAVRAIRDKNLELQQERAVLLGALGLPEDALDDKPA